MGVNVLVTHLSAFEPENRPPQVGMLKGLAHGLGGSTVVMGDFNCLPSGEMGIILREGKFVSTRALLGMGEAIDDILVSRGLIGSVASGGIIESVASDHAAYWIVIDEDKVGREITWALYE
jgi:endonuclease/exonuclease/phosphatase family metal-dependent hydrolase